MSMRRRTTAVRALLLAAILACASSAAVARADDGAAAALPAPSELSVLVETLRANRAALVAVNLVLSAEEAAKFWPIYERYQKDLAVPGDGMAAIVEDYIKNFRTLPDDKALQLVEGYTAAEAERLTIRSAYMAEMAKVLPGRTVARFFQIENKMDAVLRYELAATIPVIDEKAAAPAK